ncbi:HTTM domain-containing protein [Natrialbaceae archaeon A-gly3]
MGLQTRPALPEPVHRLWNYLRGCVRIDTRALAAFRIVAGSLIVADLLLRSRNFTFFYTDDGVVPRTLAMELSSGYSIYHLTTSSTLIAALFLVQGIFALQLLVGYKTRAATVVSFLFVISLDHHNPFVLSYADTLFRLLLFWAIFLPLGERWSVDAVARDRTPRASVAGIASTLILGQMVYMYFTNGLIKSQSDVWTSGDAAPQVLAMDEITFLLGDVVSQFPTMLEVGSLLWFYMLVGSPLLILLRGWPRIAFAGLFFGGHAAFALTVRIGAFAYVAIAGLLLFAQAPFWEDTKRLLAAAGVDIAGRYERTRGQLEAVATALPAYRVDSGRATAVRGHAYNATLGIVVAAMLVFAAVLVVTVAGAVVDENDDRPLEERVEVTIDETLENSPIVSRIDSTAERFGVDQPIGWGVFAGPDPRTEDRYYVFPAETESGDRIDVWNGRELAYDRPGDQLQKQYGTYRERFYMNSVRRGGSGNDVALNLAEYICEQWSAERDDDLAYLNMYVVGEDVTLETLHSPDDRERSYTAIYRHGCGDREPKVINPPE